MNGPSDPEVFEALRAAARERMRLIRAEQERVHREIAEGEGRAQPPKPLTGDRQ